MKGKFVCIGRNYAKHIRELGSKFSRIPLLFLKPASCFLDASGPKPAKFNWLPVLQSLHYECEILVKISKTGANIKAKNARKHFDEISLGFDLTDRTLQKQQKVDGHPWEKSKCFDGAAPVGRWIKAEEAMNKSGNVLFHCERNGKTVQKGNSRFMMTPIDQLIEYASTYFTLCKGDILFTGTPEGVGEVFPGDTFEAFIGKKSVLKC
jgi:2-keto-4-pentenoate hydratase/2-oxohepta-3-ene-1,7-dioic acid hydratase in catechol pathway